MKTKHPSHSHSWRPGARARLAVVALALATFPIVAQETPPPPPDSGGNPGATGALALQEAKVAEEGDLDLPRAWKLYEGVVNEYDALRPRAAEALFRLAEIARKTGATNEARVFYGRVSGEFVGVGDFAQRSDAVLNEAGSPHAFGMSPELMRRYGLFPGGAGGTPPATDAQPTSGMDPALAARYGLGPRQAGGGRGQSGSAAFRARYGGAEVAPEAGMEAGGSPRPGTAVAEMSTQTGGGPSMVPGRASEASAEVLALRSELSANAARLRKVRRDLRVVAACEVHPSEIPVELVEDPRLLALVRGCEEAASLQASTVGPDATADKTAREAAVRAVDSARRSLADYLSRYTKRLERAVAVLEQEGDRLRRELDELLAEEAKRR